MPKLSEMINIKASKSNAVIETDYFYVDKSKSEFVLKSNVDSSDNLLVFVDGYEVSPSDYTINKNIVKFKNPLSIGKRIRIVHFKNIVTDKDNKFLVEYFDGGNDSYKLSKNSVSKKSIIVTVNGLIQSDYEIINNNILKFNTPPSDNSKIVVIHMVGSISFSPTLLDNSVSLSHLALDSIDTRYAKIDNVYDKITIDQKINNLINNAPELLNSLSEIAKALNNDPNFSKNIMDLINTKSPLNHHHNDIYYTKQEVDLMINSKSNKDSHFDQGQILTLLGEKANKTDVYTKSEINNLILNGLQPTNIIHPGNRGVVFGGSHISGLSFNIEYFTINTFGNCVKFGNLQEGKRNASSASNGINNNAIIAGGFSNNSNISKIEKININILGISTDFGNLTAPRSEHTSVSNGTNNRAVIIGGNGGFNFDMEYVTINNPSNSLFFGNLLGSNKNGIAGTSNGKNDRGVFGSLSKSNNVYVNEFISIPVLSNSVEFGTLYPSAYISALSNDTNNRGVFGGGFVNNITSLNRIDFINIAIQGNSQNFGTLTISRGKLAATSNGTNERGVFIGGSSNNNYLSTLDYITISINSNAAPFGDLIIEKSNLAATSNSAL